MPGSVNASIAGYEVLGELVISGVTLSQFNSVAAQLAFAAALAQDARVPSDAIQLQRAYTNPDGSIRVAFAVQGFPSTVAGGQAATDALSAVEADGGFQNIVDALSTVLQAGSIACELVPGAGILAVYAVAMEVTSKAATGEMHLYSTAGSGVLEAAVQDALASMGAAGAGLQRVYVGPASPATTQNVMKATASQACQAATLGETQCPVCQACPPPPPAVLRSTAGAAAPAAAVSRLLLLSAAVAVLAAGR